MELLERNKTGEGILAIPIFFMILWIISAIGTIYFLSIFDIDSLLIILISVLLLLSELLIIIALFYFAFTTIRLRKVEDLLIKKNIIKVTKVTKYFDSNENEISEYIE